MMEYDELVTMAKIRASGLGDSTIAIAYLVSDQDWRKAAECCYDQLTILSQLAGALSRLISLEPQTQESDVSRTPETIAVDQKGGQPKLKL